MKRVLIVEDTSDLGRLLVAAISTISRDIHAEVMPSAEEAFLEMERLPADLLITDIRLPGMPGTELLKKTHNRFPNTKIIVMTGLPDPSNRMEALAAGADVFLSKPFEMGEFLDSIQRLLVIGQPEEPARETDTDTQTPGGQISDILTGLRQRLGADGVILVNESGHVAALAGALPTDLFESEWSPALLVAASAGKDLAHLVDGDRIKGVTVFRGGQMDLLLAPVNIFALAITIPSGKNSLRLPVAIEEILRAQEELQGTLSKKGLKTETDREDLVVAKKSGLQVPLVQPAGDDLPEIETETETTALQDLTELLTTAANGNSQADPEAFWEAAAKENASLPVNPDVLSYEQAFKLGLVPNKGQN